MELKPGEAPAFDVPQAAFNDYRPGMSPYIHRWLDLNGRLTGGGNIVAPPVSTQIEAALRELIETALGDQDGPRFPDHPSDPASREAP